MDEILRHTGFTISVNHPFFHLSTFQDPLDIQQEWRRSAEQQPQVREYIKALEHNSRAGDSQAALRLAEIYTDSPLAASDSELGIKWRKFAARLGDAAAQFKLCLDYGFQDNFDEEIKWCGMAANSGSYPHQIYMSDLYSRYSPNRKENNLEAYYWQGILVKSSMGDAKRSKKQSESDSGRLKYLSTLITPEELAEAKERIKAWEKTPVASKPQSSKLVPLPVVFIEPSTPQSLKNICTDVPNQEEFLLSLPNQRSIETHTKLIDYYIGQKEHKKAFTRINSAARDGVPLAQYYLGRAYASDVVPIKKRPPGVEDFLSSAANNNDLEAIYWFHQAANNGLAEAQYILGSLYMDGRGVEKNLGEAYFWMRLAAWYPNLESKKIRDTLEKFQYRLQRKQIDSAEERLSKWRRHRSAEAYMFLLSRRFKPRYENVKNSICSPPTVSSRPNVYQLKYARDICNGLVVVKADFISHSSYKFVEIETGKVVGSCLSCGYSNRPLRWGCGRP